MSNNFFLDVLNQILKINEESIMIIFDREGNIWFKFKDLLIALGYTSIDKTINNFNITSTNKAKYDKIKVIPSMILPPNFQKNTIFINESGLYEVLSNSTKPLAKQFMNKYFKDIMPEIRKNGLPTDDNYIYYFIIIIRAT
jgi:prophage antirepressor-like protein